ncbi:O-unit flippase-like protein [Roseateles sp.]|uniref:O-unit flippase-like protein n=1 Tax=Roseateles sp. TaxID=1971397 RepID=UPI003265BACB
MKARTGFIWAISANVANAALWAIVIPVSSRYLGAEETAIWLNFVVMAGVGQLLELGFNPTLARSFSYVYAGAQSLRAVGLDESHGPVNHPLLAQLIFSSRKIYYIVGALSAATLWGGGTLYLLNVLPPGTPADGVLTAWLIYSSGCVISLWFGYTNSMILGHGDVNFYNQTLVLTRGLQLAVSIGALVAGGGLACLALGALGSAIVGRAICYRHVRAELQCAHAIGPLASDINALVRVLWHNSGRYGLVMLGAFLITRANLLIAGLTIGVVPAAGYSFSVQVLTFLQSLAGVPFSMKLPVLNTLWARQQRREAEDMFAAALALGIVMFIVGAAGFVTIGPFALAQIKGNLILPDTWILLAMSLIFLFELNHGNCANLLTISNKVPFVTAALVTGLMIVIGSWIVAPHFGVLGLVMVVGMSQLSFNNWVWPRAACSMLNTTYSRLLKQGFSLLVDRAKKYRS